MDFKKLFIHGQLVIILVGVLSVSCSHSSLPLLLKSTLVDDTETAIDPEVRDWKIYRNEEFRFELAYPMGVRIDEPKKGPFEIAFYLGDEDPFYLRATREYLQGDVIYFLDTATNGTRTLGAYSWKTFEIPDGYGDATGVSPPIYALRKKGAKVLYTTVFYNQSTMKPLQAQILSTLHILEE